MEKSLKRNGLLDHYNEIFMDSIERGVQDKVTEEEIADWVEAGGKIHYIGHH